MNRIKHGLTAGRGHPPALPRNLLIATLILSSLVVGFSFSVGMADESDADASFTEDGIRYTVSDGVAKVIGYTGTSTEVEIPSTISYDGSTYNVTSINTTAFHGSSITKVATGANVTYIGSNAFMDCTELTDVEIQGQITTVEANLFSDCTALTTVNIPDSVTTIGPNAFYNCISLESISIPDSVTSVSSNVFYGCSKLSNVTIGSGLGAIGDSMFQNCTSLASITIPAGITTIKMAAFSGCTKLASIVIPDSVTYLEYMAFSGCTALGSVTFGSSVSTVSYRAFGDIKFYDTDGTTELTRTDDLKGQTFVGTYPELIKVGSSDTKTVDGVTYKLVTPSSGDRYVSVIGNVQSEIPDGKVAILDTVDFDGVSYDVTTIKDSAFSGCTSATSVVIPDSVTTVEENTFKNCTGLESAVIGNNVTYLPISMFEGCSSLKELTLGEKVDNFGFYGVFEGCSGISVTILCPIKGSMFSGWTCFTKVTIGSGIGEIGSSAFQSCRTLESVTFEDSNILKTIGDYAFQNCESLESINLDKTSKLETIGSYAFSGCSSLGSIEIPSTVKTIGSDAFYSCKALGSVTIPALVETIEPFAFAECESLESVEIASGVKKIEYCAFYYSKIKHITIPSSVVDISNDAFNGISFYDADGKTSLSVSAGSLAGYTFEGESGDVLVKKQGVVASHSVTYDANGGTEDAPGVEYYTENQTFAVKGYSGTRNGFTFGGWSDGTRTYQPGQSITMGTTNIVLTAVWNPISTTYSVTYDVNGGSVAAPTQGPFETGQTFKIQGYSGTKNGYRFGGWSDGTRTYQPGQSMTMGTTDITLKAVWNPSSTFWPYAGDEDVPVVIPPTPAQNESEDDGSTMAAIVATGCVIIILMIILFAFDPRFKR